MPHGSRTETILTFQPVDDHRVDGAAICFQRGDPRIAFEEHRSSLGSDRAASIPEPRVKLIQRARCRARRRSLTFKIPDLVEQFSLRCVNAPVFQQLPRAGGVTGVRQFLIDHGGRGFFRDIAKPAASTRWFHAWHRFILSAAWLDFIVPLSGERLMAPLRPAVILARRPILRWPVLPWLLGTVRRA